jgi:hypothetical protein
MKIYGKVLDELERAAMDGLEESAKQVLADARARVPVDDGQLRRSGKVVKHDLAVEVRFTAPHAWLQHETLDYQHPNGGEPKFLENAAIEFDVGAVVGGHIRAVLGG